MRYYDKMRLDNLINITSIKYKKIVNAETLKKLLTEMEASNKPYSLLRDEIYSIFLSNNSKTAIDSVMKKYGIVLPLQNATEKKDMKKQLNMEKTTEFAVNNIPYIKITLSDGSIKILENRDTIELSKIFDSIQQDYNINNSDGKLNAEKIFQILENSKIDVKLNPINEINKGILSEKANRELNEVKKAFPNDQIIAAPENGIFINKNKSDMLIQVVKSDNGYEVRQIQEKIYKTKEVSNEKQAENYDTFTLNDLTDELNEDSIVIEQPEDIPYEKTITNGRLNEEQAFEYLKEQKLERVKIVAILKNLRNKNMTKSKQLVKTKPNAYIDLFVIPLIIIFLSALLAVIVMIRMCI